jgi:hypothetical protein
MMKRASNQYFFSDFCIPANSKDYMSYEVSVDHIFSEVAIEKAPAAPKISHNTLSSLADLIRRDFQGVNITIFFTNGSVLEGQVVSGFDNIVRIKDANNITHYVNTLCIAQFF